MASALLASIESTLVPSATELLINNRWVESESGESFATVNPATGKEILPGCSSGYGLQQYTEVKTVIIKL